KKDPFDVFDWLDTLHQKFHLHPAYFFLTILQRGLYDKNINSHNRSLQKLYQQLASKYNNGLHPTWQSGERGFDALLNKEKQQLEKIIQQPVSKSRFHYLRFNLPEGYRKLIKNGITEDYSMGYATISGFRASYAKPFYWYDLLQEQKTDLLIHPFCWMDATASFEERLTAEEAYATLQTFYNLVRSVGGECTIILHNHFLTEQQDWIEWRKSYELFLSSNCNETAP
ncbi:MAG: hypothetical protein KGO81_13920, partial [Bacteroidota bacterium]|nr:hypothetical protein [Bacteroidota bacterium]